MREVNLIASLFAAPNPSGITFNSSLGAKSFYTPYEFPNLPIVDGPGVYVILAPSSSWGPRPYRPIYFGETEDFSRRIGTSHEHYWDWRREAGSLQLYVAHFWMYGSSNQDRLTVEQALIDWYKPPVNTAATLKSLLPNLFSLTIPPRLPRLGLAEVLLMAAPTRLPLNPPARPLPTLGLAEMILKAPAPPPPFIAAPSRNILPSGLLDLSRRGSPTSGLAEALLKAPAPPPSPLPMLTSLTALAGIGLWAGLTRATTASPPRRIPLVEITPVRVFTSFDYDHDSSLRMLLVGQGKHPDTPFEMHDWSVKEPFRSDWKEMVRQKIRKVDQVIVICGEHTDTAAGVAAELEIARQENKPYFLLCGYKDKTCRKPKTARSEDKMYRWNWPNLKSLIGGGR